MDLPEQPPDGGEVAAPARSEWCPACRASVLSTDPTCGQCGADLERRRAVRKHKRERNARTRAERRQTARATEQRKVVGAASWLALMAVAFVVAGTLLGTSARFEAQRAHAELDRFPHDQVLDFGDARMTAAERLQQFDLRVWLAFGVQYLLAASMLALFLWARRSPLPALITAFALYAALVAANAAVDPENLRRGMVMKGVVVAVLGAGIAAAWREREAATESRHRLREAARMARSGHPR